MYTTPYTRALYPYEALFTPLECGTLNLKNRIIAVPPDGLTALRAERFALEAAAGGAGSSALKMLSYAKKFVSMEAVHFAE